MSEQLRLFERGLGSWVERVWTKVDSDRRREIVAVLAEMGRCTLEQQGESAKEVKPNES